MRPEFKRRVFWVLVILAVAAVVSPFVLTELAGDKDRDVVLKEGHVISNTELFEHGSITCTLTESTKATITETTIVNLGHKHMKYYVKNTPEGKFFPCDDGTQLFKGWVNSDDFD